MGTPERIGSMVSYAPHFLSWVSEVAKADFKEFSNVKKVCIAQSIRETGRGNTAISKDHNNLLGVKYHDFLEDLAIEYKYYTDSEPKQPDGSQGFAMFCSFYSPYNCAVAWQRWFKYWEHYKDALTKLDNPEAFLKEIAHHYAADAKYEQAVLALFSEAQELLDNAVVAPPEPADPVKEFEIRLDKIEKDVVILKEDIAKLKKPSEPSFVYKYVNTAQDSNLNVRKSPNASDVIITALPYGFKVACYEIKDGWYHVKGMKDNVNFDGWASATYLVDNLPTKQYKIMVNMGHHGTSGASGKTSNVKEEVENEATGLKLKELLCKHPEFLVSVVNQDDNSIGLEGVGKATKDYDCAIAIHYNASDNVEHGYEVLVPTGASTAIKSFATNLCSEMGKYKSGMSNRGVKEKSLSVFTGYKAIPDNKCIFVLSEGYFIDAYSDNSVVRSMSLDNAQAHYNAIKKLFNVQ